MCGGQTDKLKSAEAQRAQHAAASAEMHLMVTELEQVAQDASMRAGDASQEASTLKRELQTIK